QYGRCSTGCGASMAYRVEIAKSAQVQSSSKRVRVLNVHWTHCKRHSLAARSRAGCEPGAVECDRDFGILHEPRPYTASPQVFSAQQRDAEIDPDYVRIDPPGRRMKCVRKTVARVDAIPERPVHLAQRGHGDLGREHERAAGRGRHDGTVDGMMPGWTTPGDVPFLAVGRGDAPDRVGIAWKLGRKAQTKGLVRACRRHRVLEPVDARRLALAAPPKVAPRVRILVHEQWIAGADKRVALERHDWTRPGAPGRRRQGMRRRSDPEQIQNHQLAVVIPPPLEKSGFRLPAVRQDAR